MKTRMKGRECVETKKVWRWKMLLPTTALIYALFWAPQEWSAQTISRIEWWANQTEMTSPVKTDSKEKTKTLQELMDELDNKKEWKTGIWVSWFIQVWTSVVPDFAGVFSDKPSMLLCVDASDKKSWLWISYIRLDDFHEDPDYPVSKASVFVPHRNKSLKDWKWDIWASVECTFIDQQPEGTSIMPVIVWTYNTSSWWSFEWKYFHGFQKGQDTDAIRLWITKKIWDALSITAQWWYQTDYDKKVFWRIIADIDLWNWFGAQVSWIAKDWKITPTAWVIYKF